MQSRTRPLCEHSSWPLILVDTSVILADPDVIVRIIGNSGLPVITDAVLASIESAWADGDQLRAQNARRTHDLLFSRPPVEIGALPNGRPLLSDDKLRRLTFKDCPVYLFSRTRASDIATSSDTLIALARDYGMRLITQDASLQTRAALAGATADLWTGPRRGDSEVVPTATPRSSNKRSGGLVVLALLSIAVIIWLYSQRSPVEPPPTPQTAEQSDYAGDVQRLVEQARSSDDKALRRLEQALDELSVKYDSEFTSAASQAAQSVSTFDSMGTIVYKLAADLPETTKATEYLNEQVAPLLDPKVKAFAEELNHATAVFETDLHAISFDLAKELAALGPGDPAAPQRVVPTGDARRDFEQVLKNFGLDSASAIISVAFDAYAIANSAVIRVLLRGIVTTTASLFKKQVVRVAASIGAAVVDGPAPFGDLLMAAGLAYTGYQLRKMRNNFHGDVKVAVLEELTNIRTGAVRQARQAAQTKVSAFKKVQCDIGDQSLKQLSNQ